MVLVDHDYFQVWYDDNISRFVSMSNGKAINAANGLMVLLLEFDVVE